MSKNIHAYTEPGFNPAYISVNVNEEDSYIVSVRSAGEEGCTAEITLDKKQLLELAEDIERAFSDAG